MPASDKNAAQKIALQQLASAMLYFGLATAAIGSILLYHSLALLLYDGPLPTGVLRGALALILGLSGLVWVACSIRFRKLAQMKSYSVDDLLSGIKLLSFSFLILAILASLRVVAQTFFTFDLILFY